MADLTNKVIATNFQKLLNIDSTNASITDGTGSAVSLYISGGIGDAGGDITASGNMLIQCGSISASAGDGLEMGMWKIGKLNGYPTTPSIINNQMYDGGSGIEGTYYALQQDTSGNTSVNSKTGYSVNLAIGSVTKVLLGTNSNVKLGTSIPLTFQPPEKLTVEGNISSSGDLKLLGDITASNIVVNTDITSSGVISSSDNIISNNITSSGYINANMISASGHISCSGMLKVGKYLGTPTQILMDKDGSFQGRIGLTDNADQQMVFDNLKGYIGDYGVAAKWVFSATSVSATDPDHAGKMVIQSNDSTPTLPLLVIYNKSNNNNSNANMGFECDDGAYYHIGTYTYRNEFVIASGSNTDTINPDSVLTVSKTKVSGSGTSTGSFGSLKIDGASVDFSNLPTSDPSVAGRLWSDSGTVKVSAG